MIRILIILSILATPAFAQFTNVQRQELPFQNLVLNGGAENSVSKWAASGGALNQAVTPAKGRGTFQWNASATGQYLTSTAATVPPGLYGRNGAANCIFKTDATDYKLQVYDGSNVLVERTIPATTNYAPLPVNFIFPSSGSLSIRIASQSNAADLFMDDCFLGDANAVNLGSVSQATIVGKATQPGGANCKYAESTSTGLNDWKDLGTAGSCASAWTVSGALTATGATAHTVTYSNMPPGAYEIRLTSSLYASAAGSCVYRFSDSTNAFGFGTSYSAGGAIAGQGIFGSITYTDAATRTFKVQAADDHAGNCNLALDNAGQQLEWEFKRFPTSAEQAMRIENAAQSWSGLVGNSTSCDFTTSSATFADLAADADCTLTERTNRNFGTVTQFQNTGNGAGIVFTPPKATRYFVQATASWYQSTGSAFVGMQLYDGTNVIGEATQEAKSTGQHITTVGGILVASSTTPINLRLRSKTSAGALHVLIQNGGAGTPAIEWSIIAIDQALPAPYLVGGLSTSSAGQERIERVRIKTTCTTGNCTLESNTPGITTVAFAATGRYTLNFSPAFAAAPTCLCSGYISGSENLLCSSSAVNDPTTTTAEVYMTKRDTGNATNGGFTAICMGPK